MTLPVADKLDILELLARADSAASERDANGYVSCFTEDVVLNSDMGEHRSKGGLASIGRSHLAEGRSGKRPSYAERHD